MDTKQRWRKEVNVGISWKTIRMRLLLIETELFGRVVFSK